MLDSHDPVGKPVSASSSLAEELHTHILAGRWPVGTALPSERALMAQYNVSRATVREALRHLSAQELIKVRRGRGGGSFVANPSGNVVSRSLYQFINGQQVRYVDLVYAREAIEVAAGIQAATSRTEESLRELETCCAECEREVGDIDRFVEANLRWHRALVEASGNPLFIAFMASLTPALHDATSSKEFDIQVRKSVVGIHWQIFNAIRDRDPEAAQRRMTRHLSAYREKLKTIDLP